MAGRPTKYKPEHLDQVYKLSLLGLTDDEMADVLGVVKSTFNLWKTTYPEFSDSINKGKDIADAEIAASLYERAKGYQHPEELAFHYQGEIITHQTTKQYPPDTKAAQIWLTNRQRKKWKNIPEDDSAGERPPPMQPIIDDTDGKKKK